jgi:hypothetical protein
MVALPSMARAKNGGFHRRTLEWERFTSLQA